MGLGQGSRALGAGGLGNARQLNPGPTGGGRVCIERLTHALACIIMSILE